MHRDVKLGLALGMLVIGFAAAFCFPRQPSAQHLGEMKTELSSAESGDELVHMRADEAERVSQSQAKPLLSRSAFTPSVPAVVQQTQPMASAISSLNELPTALEGPTKGLGIAATPRPAPPLPAITDVLPETPASAMTGEKQYIVEAGDTLSDIASRFLGSSVRYREIMEINPSLTSPNLISPGMVIRIPQSIPALANDQSVTEPASMAPFQRPVSLPFSEKPAGQISQDGQGSFH